VSAKNASGLVSAKSVLTPFIPLQLGADATVLLSDGQDDIPLHRRNRTTTIQQAHLARSSPNFHRATVTLTQSALFALTLPTEVIINGKPPSGQKDSLGRFFDGGHTGKARSNGVVIFESTGVTLQCSAA
jgi:hypothetical protein